MIKLSGKTALITGAMSGIGKEIAYKLAENNVNLYLLGRNKTGLKKLKNSLNNLGDGEINIGVLDLYRDFDDITKYLNSSVKHIDILIHCAGVLISKSIEETNFKEADEQLKVNFLAPFFITKTLLPLLKKNKGQIVFINSSIIYKTNSNLSIYSATKNALKGFSDTLREEVNDHGVKVINIIPGQTATKMLQNLYKLNNKIYLSEILIQPEDIANTVIYTLSLPKTAEIIELYIRPHQKNKK